MPVGRIGPFSSDLERLVQESDSARAYARGYRADQTAAVALSLLGSAVFVFSTLHAPFDSDTQFLGLVIGGGVTLGSAYFGVQAQRALARAVWWYNRSLEQSP